MIFVPAFFFVCGIAGAQNPPEPAQNERVPAEKSCRNARACRIAIADDDLPMPPPGAFSKEEAQLLKTLFSMSDAELRRLRGFIQFLEKLSPEKKKRMAADFARATSDMSPEERKAYFKEMRERFRRNQENLLERYYATLLPEQADAERKKFLSLGKNERRAYLFDVRKKLGYAPPPPPLRENPPKGERPREREN